MFSRLADLSEADKKFASEMIEWGLLPTVVEGESIMFTTVQYERIKKLVQSDTSSKFEKAAPYSGFQLFPSDHELALSHNTRISRAADPQKNFIGSKVLLQILPNLLERVSNTADIGALGYVDLPGASVDVVSENAEVLRVLEQQGKKFRLNAENRSAFFSRSASYMGSKAALAAALIEVIDNFSHESAIVVDVMCGSGAAAGAFARSRPVFASDAQLFSQYLAIVQGGGMTEARAKTIVASVTENSLSHYSALPQQIFDDIDKEEYYLTTELSSSDKEDFIAWVQEYPRVGNNIGSANGALASQLKRHRDDPASLSGILFVKYYANLFFGVRQAAEIDCLRIAVDKISDPNDRAWALGALICAVSACADNYGGHFAQPKFDITQPGRILSSLKDTLLKRTLSVTHEFSARLLHLARESESIPNAVDVIPGPWKKALHSIAEMPISVPIMVYLDPPYTREEYSRYYHVLETLVRYDYPEVSGKSSAPVKGGAGRFASEFFTRCEESAAKYIIDIIITCLQNGWDCTWSYSSSGLASVTRVIEACAEFCTSVELFNTQYSYKAQGKQRAKAVEEYIIVFKANKALAD
jgi:adenine-specific DNA-methyltransferase